VVERGEALEQLIASRITKNGNRARVFCPCPQMAQYEGTSTDDAANFVCKPLTV